MRYLAWAAGFLTLLVAGYACGFADERQTAQDERILFRFAPSDGAVWMETADTTRQTDLGGLGVPRTDVSHTEVRTVVKAGPNGYQITSTILEAQATRDGKPLNDPLMAGMRGMCLVYDVDREAQLRSVRGYDQVISKVEQRLREEAGPEPATAMSRVLNEEMLVAKERAEWNGRVASFAGREAKVGDVWEGTDVFTLPSGGDVTSYVTTSFTERVQHAGRDCVRIRFEYSSDAAALAKLAGKVVEDAALAGGIKEAPAKVGGAATVVGSGERIVDPSTMTIFSETLERTLAFPMDVPGKGTITVTRKERRVYSMEYTRH